jgi:hypothetical protein
MRESAFRAVAAAFASIRRQVSFVLFQSCQQFFLGFFRQISAGGSDQFFGIMNQRDQILDQFLPGAFLRGQVVEINFHTVPVATGGVLLNANGRLSSQQETQIELIK